MKFMKLMIGTLAVACINSSFAAGGPRPAPLVGTRAADPVAAPTVYTEITLDVPSLSAIESADSRSSFAATKGKGGSANTGDLIRSENSDDFFRRLKSVNTGYTADQLAAIRGTLATQESVSASVAAMSAQKDQISDDLVKANAFIGKAGYSISHPTDVAGNRATLSAAAELKASLEARHAKCAEDNSTTPECTTINKMYDSAVEIGNKCSDDKAESIGCSNAIRDINQAMVADDSVGKYARNLQTQAQSLSASIAKVTTDLGNMRALETLTATGKEILNSAYDLAKRTGLDARMLALDAKTLSLQLGISQQAAAKLIDDIANKSDNKSVMGQSLIGSYVNGQISNALSNCAVYDAWESQCNTVRRSALQPGQVVDGSDKKPETEKEIRKVLAPEADER